MLYILYRSQQTLQKTLRNVKVTADFIVNTVQITAVSLYTVLNIKIPVNVTVYCKPCSEYRRVYCPQFWTTVYTRV